MVNIIEDIFYSLAWNRLHLRSPPNRTIIFFSHFLFEQFRKVKLFQVNGTWILLLHFSWRSDKLSFSEFIFPQQLLSENKRRW